MSVPRDVLQEGKKEKAPKTKSVILTHTHTHTHTHIETPRSWQEGGGGQHVRSNQAMAKDWVRKEDAKTVGV